MYIKNLKIATDTHVIRDIEFKSGLNLIVDLTSTEDSKQTGNNVGKTTVLKLIDYCLGASAKTIYTDSESNKNIYAPVRDFLHDNNVLVTLVLTSDLDDDTADLLTIERNFLPQTKSIRRINGQQVLAKDFEAELMRHIIPTHSSSKPTFRQIISHNIRYKDNSINNTLRTLDAYTSNIEYETLHLFLLGSASGKGDYKKELSDEITQEKKYKSRLEEGQTKNQYKAALEVIEADILRLEEERNKFGSSTDFEKQFEELNRIKRQINRLSTKLSQLNIKRDLIEEAKEEMKQEIADINLKRLKLLYMEVAAYIQDLNKSFDDLVQYHNTMIVERLNFITADLPELNRRIREMNNKLSDLLSLEQEYANRITKSDTYEEMEQIITSLYEKYQQKGEFEATIAQIERTEDAIEKLQEEVDRIDDLLFSDDFEEKVSTQVSKFNRYFSSISNELYGESYALSYEIKNTKGLQTYEFTAFNTNMSTGKKQGEILCFDLAYIKFADDEGIPCLHFLLNDKKELMHDNQLNLVAKYVKRHNIQLVISMLRDKLPEELLKHAHIALELSQQDKLFRIE